LRERRRARADVPGPGLAAVEAGARGPGDDVAAVRLGRARRRLRRSAIVARRRRPHRARRVGARLRRPTSAAGLVARPAGRARDVALRRLLAFATDAPAIDGGVHDGARTATICRATARRGARTRAVLVGAERRERALVGEDGGTLEAAVAGRRRRGADDGQDEQGEQARRRHDLPPVRRPASPSRTAGAARRALRVRAGEVRTSVARGAAARPPTVKSMSSSVKRSRIVGSAAAALSAASRAMWATVWARKSIAKNSRWTRRFVGTSGSARFTSSTRSVDDSKNAGVASSWGRIPGSMPTRASSTR